MGAASMEKQKENHINKLHIRTPNLNGFKMGSNGQIIPFNELFLNLKCLIL
jgi:hypothetical protein